MQYIICSTYLGLDVDFCRAIAAAIFDNPNQYAISNTIANQTGRSVEMLVIIMVTYLTINLFISAIMNRFNALVQLKEC